MFRIEQVREKNIQDFFFHQGNDGEKLFKWFGLVGRFPLLQVRVAV